MILPPPGETARRTVSVLVVDDSQPVRDTIRTIVEMLPGCRVAGEAADGPSAVAEARRLSPDVVLMDINLPGCDGLAAAQQILAATPTRVIVISVENGREYFRRALQVGACNFLVKPFTPESLEAAIRGAMGEGPAQRRRQLVLVGARGGVGTSSLAVHIAARLQASALAAWGESADTLQLLAGERQGLAVVPYREDLADDGGLLVVDGGRMPPDRIPHDATRLVVLEPSVAALHAAARYGPPYVLNRAGCPGALAREDVARALGRAPTAVLPEDGAVREAANLGRLADLARGPWHAAVTELLGAMGLLAPAATHKPARGLLKALRLAPGGDRP
jgi:DNA-binding NarL/FixJ family response regulator